MDYQLYWSVSICCSDIGERAPRLRVAEPGPGASESEREVAPRDRDPRQRVRGRLPRRPQRSGQAHENA